MKIMLSSNSRLFSIGDNHVLVNDVADTYCLINEDALAILLSLESQSKDFHQTLYARHLEFWEKLNELKLITFWGKESK